MSTFVGALAERPALHITAPDLPSTTSIQGIHVHMATKWTRTTTKPPRDNVTRPQTSNTSEHGQRSMARDIESHRQADVLNRRRNLNNQQENRQSWDSGIAIAHSYGSGNYVDSDRRYQDRRPRSMNDGRRSHGYRRPPNVVVHNDDYVEPSDLHTDIDLASGSDLDLSDVRFPRRR